MFGQNLFWAISSVFIYIFFPTKGGRGQTLSGKFHYFLFCFLKPCLIDQTLNIYNKESLELVNSGCSQVKMRLFNLSAENNCNF